jgi:hypothetical protein
VSGLAMCGRTCVLAVLIALGGCASMPETIRGVPQVNATSGIGTEDELTDLERGRPPRASRTAKRRSPTSNAVAASPAAVKVKSSASENIDEPDPDRASAARRMDEQSQRWNTAAKQAIRSICAGC